MNASDAYEREEQAIMDAMFNEEISREEGVKQLRELRRDYQGAAENAALDAYEREMERW